jgi:hypothetical protein
MDVSGLILRFVRTKMKSLRTGLLAAIAIFAFPSAAVAEELVPPGNSAVNQYTETFPTPGGDKEAKQGAKRAKPAKVLGGRNARKLEEQGPEGRKVATVAAATAPSTVVTPEPGETDSTESETGVAGSGGNDGKGRNEKTAPPPKPKQTASTPNVPRETVDSSDPDGSSGFGEILAQATGTSSSGGLGLLLPLAIIATIVWAVATRRRTRRPAQ